MLETFKSKDVEMNSPSWAVFASFSDLTQMKDRLPAEYRDKVTVTADTVEGDYQGMHLGMKVAERIPTSRIVMKPMEGFPLDFTLLFDIENITAATSKLRVSVVAEMNFLLKAMLGRKIQSILDQITDQIAARQGK
ncbi:MAG: hypothetical protein J6X91_05045 [Bacteroidales bacterium]|nr:hypothetical protein [Bacteroidales bacterium]MBP5518005.1 hypothetical protein [Bacteroidales bacterium]